MKKLLCLILIMIIPTMALATVPDISDLNFNELMELNRQIQLALFDKKLVEGIHVPQGIYTIGEDIPAGVYRIEIVDGTGLYEVYDKNGEMKLSGMTGDLVYVTEIGKITLEDGDQLHIVNSSFVFFPYAGIFH